RPLWLASTFLHAAGLHAEPAARGARAPQAVWGEEEGQVPQGYRQEEGAQAQGGQEGADGQEANGQEADGRPGQDAEEELPQEGGPQVHAEGPEEVRLSGQGPRGGWRS